MKNSFDSNHSHGAPAHGTGATAASPRRSLASFWILLGVGLSLGTAAVLLYIAQKNVNARHGEKLSGDVPISKTLATRLEWKMEPPQMTARQTNLWSIKIVDAKEIDQRNSTPDNPRNKYIRSFVWDGDNLINLMLVARDNSYFARLKPEYKDYGHFLLSVTVPRPGKYTLIADYLPHNKDKREIVLHDFEVEGTPVQTAIGSKRESAVNPEGVWDLGTPKSEYSIRLQNGQLRANQPETLTLILHDKEQPVTNIESYQGVVARCAIVSDDFKTYVHAAPETKQSNNGRGPQISFTANFPRAGKYTLWAQFQHRGQVITQPIGFEVK
jgi:hypothetical protein